VAVRISKSNKDGGKRIGYSIPEIPMGDKSKGKRVSTAVFTDNGTFRVFMTLRRNPQKPEQWDLLTVFKRESIETAEGICSLVSWMLLPLQAAVNKTLLSGTCLLTELSRRPFPGAAVTANKIVHDLLTPGTSINTIVVDWMNRVVRTLSGDLGKHWPPTQGKFKKCCAFWKMTTPTASPTICFSLF
jgi:hypothetical protein